MNQGKDRAYNRIIRSTVFFLLIIGISIYNFSTSPTAVAQETEPPMQAEEVAAQTGIDVTLVAEMLAAGIPPVYINQEMAAIFVAEIRQELSLPTTEPPLVSDPTPNSASAIESITPAAKQNVRLRSCNSQNFPFVFLAVGVDENGRPITDLTPSNFQCFENGIRQTDLFQVTPPQNSDNVRLADIVFLIDASGSMVEEIADVRANVAAFATALGASDIDFRLGLVQFGNNSGPNPFLFNGGNLTTDVDLFKSFISSIGAGGGFEPGFLALRMAVQNFNFRPGAQKVFILISDEDSDDRNQQATHDLLFANSVTVHTAVDCLFGTSHSDYCNDVSIRGATGGLLFNVVGPYNQILETIAGSTANTYILRYQSSNPNFDATTRNVECRVTTPTIQESVTCAYIPGAAPQIELTAETLTLNQTAIAEGSTPLISVLVTDQAAPFVQTVTLYYRTTGTTSGYSAVTMLNRGNNRYEATIPSVQSPGVDYYITATDGQVLSTLPSTDPGQVPFQIGVLPNVAPQILHTPLTDATFRGALPIGANVLDTTNRVATVELRWRRVGELLYRVLTMQHSSGDEFRTTIPGAEVTTELEYYLRAIDDLGVASTSGTADNPHRVALIFGESPIIFIPGIAGSRIKQPNALLDLWVSLLEPDDRIQQILQLLANGNMPGVGTTLGIAFDQMQQRAKGLTLDDTSEFYQANLIAPDALRFAFGVVPIYGPMLNTLEIDYTPYRLSGNPHLPGRSCDIEQAKEPNKPRLFVFPYDWRKSNVESAALLKTYIAECVQRHFYPNAKVDIVAHSMGGLVARRYIIDNPTTHRVDKLITVGTPWLGTPEFLKVLETGEFRPGQSIFLKKERLKELVETFPGAHELLPSNHYFGLAGTPFEEQGWDINGNAIDNEIYSYTDLRHLLDDQKYPSYTPVATGIAFHDYPQQDRWTDDRSGVEYHHIVGIQTGETTIGRIIAYRYCAFSNFVCWPIPYLQYTPTSGDGIVPLTSARRAALANTPEGSNIFIHEVRPSQERQNDEANHEGMVRSDDVQTCIFQILSDQSCPNTIRPAPGAGTAENSSVEQASNSYYLAVIGIANGFIVDSNGNLTGMYDNGVSVDYAYEASYFATGGQAFTAIVSAVESYTVTFRTSVLPFTVEIREGTAETTISATRYRDIVLPENTLVHIFLNPQGNYVVRYDGNGDGIPETELPGLVAGTEAQDIQPPKISINTEFINQQLRVTIFAQDDGSGVADIYYSWDGINFARYTEPLFVEMAQEVIHVFADDNVSNRSGLFTFPLLHRRYLPVIAFVKPPAPVNRAPNLPANPAPKTGTTITGDTVTLIWSGGDPDGNVTTYDLYLNATNGEPMTKVTSNLPTPSYTVHGLTANTQYAWRIVAKDSTGATTSGPVWRFTTAPIVPLDIQISTNSNDQYKLQRREDGEGLDVGKLVYSDRGYLYASVPDSVKGSTYIATANNDKDDETLQIRITVDKPVLIFVAHSDRQEDKPSWLDDFADTGEDLTFYSSSGNIGILSLYRRWIPAGTITLRSNDPDPSGHTMYTIVIQE